MWVRVVKVREGGEGERGEVSVRVRVRGGRVGGRAGEWVTAHRVHHAIDTALRVHMCKDTIQPAPPPPPCAGDRAVLQRQLGGATCPDCAFERRVVGRNKER